MIFGEAFRYVLILPMGGFARFDSVEKHAQALGLVADPKNPPRDCAGVSYFELSRHLPLLKKADSKVFVASRRS